MNISQDNAVAVVPIFSALSKVSKLNPVGFVDSTTGKFGVGFIIEEVKSILPEVIINKDGVDSIDNEALLAYVISAFLEARRSR
jgi:hypothetical protein